MGKPTVFWKQDSGKLKCVCVLFYIVGFHFFSLKYIKLIKV